MNETIRRAKALQLRKLEGAKTMDYKDYIKNAIRTESPKTSIVADEELLKAVSRAGIVATEALDMMKKSMFYGKKFDGIGMSKFTALLDEVAARAEFANTNLLNPEDDTPPLEINARILHAAVGIFTEAGEVLDAVITSLESGKLDLVNLHEEIGDINWYTAILLDETKGNFDEILDRNIAKLKARYPEKFSDQQAESRDLAKERGILEGQA